LVSLPNALVERLNKHSQGVGLAYLTLGILHSLVLVAFTFVYMLLNHQLFYASETFARMDQSRTTRCITAHTGDAENARHENAGKENLE